MPRRLVAGPAKHWLMAGLLLVALVMAAAPAATAGQPKPLTARQFAKAAPQGFGDRQNSWAWAMQWWRGSLYVGTNRAYRCVSYWALHHYVPDLIGYPPVDPDQDCAPDGADLPIQAEIWRWTPGTNQWQRVFQSPLAADNPERPGKKLPLDIGFRGMAVHTDPDGTEALYVVGVNARAMWTGALPPVRILRTTDGVTFTPIPQTPGTFMGDLDRASFRSPVSFNGQLFVLYGSVQGAGVVIASPDPAKGDNAWRQVSPPDLQFFEMETFNGWLYVGGQDLNGYTVLKTRATGPPPYTFIPVIQRGASLPPPTSPSVVSMYVQDGRLYVGTSTPSELIRINPDDTWDLVVGTPRTVPKPGGGTELKAPLSGLDAGFNNNFNDHIWRMQAQDGALYVGTFDASFAFKDDPVNEPILRHLMGFDLYRTTDGWYYTPLTTTGFDDPANPRDGRFDIGIRTFAATPYGLFFGTANDFYGLNIFRGNPLTKPSLAAPVSRLEAEVRADQRPVLSWDAAPGTSNVCARYRVWRAPMQSVRIRRSNTLFEGVDLPSDNKQTDWFPGPYQEIAVTSGATFVDAPLAAGSRFVYYVVAEDAQGRLSEPSNLVAVPSLAPVVTFASLLSFTDTLNQRQRFVGGNGSTTRQAIVLAQGRANAGDTANAVKQLDALRQRVLRGGIVQAPDATDLEIQLAKLIRRLRVNAQLTDAAPASNLAATARDKVVDIDVSIDGGPFIDPDNFAGRAIKSVPSNALLVVRLTVGSNITQPATLRLTYQGPSRQQFLGEDDTRASTPPSLAATPAGPNQVVVNRAVAGNIIYLTFRNVSGYNTVGAQITGVARGGSNEFEIGTSPGTCPGAAAG